MSVAGISGRRAMRCSRGGSFAERLLEVGDRADDLVERAALAAGVRESLLREKRARLFLVASARLPALEHAVVDLAGHPSAIGMLSPYVEREVTGDPPEMKPVTPHRTPHASSHVWEDEGWEPARAPSP